MKQWLVISAVAATAALTADQGMDMGEQKMSEPMINPATSPKIDNGMDWSVYLTGEALYWRAYEDNLEYAVEANRALTAPDHRLRGHTEVEDLDFKFDWGFRAGLGFGLPHDGWDFYFNYTYFFADASTKKNKANDLERALYPRFTDTITQNALGENVNAIEAKWDLHLNVFDATIGRKFGTSKWLHLKPFAGVRSIWIHEKYDLEHTGGNFAPNAIVDYLEDTVKMKNRSWGVGAIAGLATQWNFANEWSFVANFGLSILYGHFRIEQEEHVKQGDVTVYDLHHDGYHKGRAITDVMLGMRWDRMFYDGRFHFGLQLAWEEHIFFDQNQFIRFGDDFAPGVFDRGGDLTLQGLTLSACFGF